jgi:hypothetical protein
MSSSLASKATTGVMAKTMSRPLRPALAPLIQFAALIGNVPGSA